MASNNESSEVTDDDAVAAASLQTIDIKAELDGVHENESPSSEDNGLPVDPFKAFRQFDSVSSEYEPSDKELESSFEDDDPTEMTETRGLAGMLETLSSPRKRQAAVPLDLTHRPLKRLKGTFHYDYLEVLNADISDAAACYVHSTGPELPESQIGLTVWTSAEKEVFFEALARLGQDDTSGIARRLGTKGELEVKQYLSLLQDAVEARRDNDELEVLRPADFPATAELGVKCCAALEEAADSLAVRQDILEESQEQEKWRDNWLCTQINCRRVREDAENNDSLVAASFFKLENWLQLSERFFMNAPFEDGNWRSVGEVPSVRMTALDDFYSLAVSITKRILSAAMYISMSRIRSKRNVAPWTRNLVRRSDIEAAAISLGLLKSHREYWVKMARRLKLDVFEHEPRRDDEPMGYKEVEQHLSTFVQGYKALEAEFESEAPSGTSGESDSSLSLDDLIKADDISDNEEGPINEEARWEDSEEHDPEVVREALEVVRYSALGFPESKAAQKGLMKRIESEREHEAYADALDRQASNSEEKRMWRVLGRDLPDPLPEVGDLKKPTGLGPVSEVHPIGGGWREKMAYLSEWEVAIPDTRELERPRVAETHAREARTADYVATAPVEEARAGNASASKDMPELSD